MGTSFLRTSADGRGRTWTIVKSFYPATRMHTNRVMIFDILNRTTTGTLITDKPTTFFPFGAQQLPHSVNNIHDVPALLPQLFAELDVPLLTQGRPINAV